MNPAVQLTSDNPWPGLDAYNEASKDFFFGRRSEAEELVRLIRLAPLTVVYGKSGLGKTSLLQAGVFPLLREAHFLPVHIRIRFSDAGSAQPFDIVKRRLLEELARVEHPDPLANESMWEYLHRKDLEIWSTDNFPLIPVLVFDQFEEVFSRSGGNLELVKKVLDPLADLIENRIPAEVATEHAVSARARLDLQSQRYRIVLSFREDFLPDIRTWERNVPSLLRNYLRLDPMSQGAATQAVTQAGEAILDADVAPHIVDFVGRLDRTSDAAAPAAITIEPVLLSLCCYQLNRRRQFGARINRSLVDEAGQDILDDFYRRALGDPDVAGPPDAAAFIEEALIQGERFRGDYPRDAALEEGSLTTRQLDTLTDRHRLLRVVHHSDTARVELIHDRLVPVVWKAREERRVQQLQLEQERQVRQAQAEIEKERARSEELQRQRDAVSGALRIAKRRRNIAVAAALLSLALVGWAGVERRRAEGERQRAQEEARQKELARVSSEVALNTARLAAGRLRFGPGHEPLEQTMLRGLAAYRLTFSNPDLAEARIESLVALHSVLENTTHLRKAISLLGFVPTAALAYSADGNMLAVGGEDGTVLLLDAKEDDGTLAHPQAYREQARLSCEIRDENAWSLSFNRSGTRLVVGFTGRGTNLGRGAVCVFDVSTRQPLRSWSLKDAKADVYSAIYGGPPGSELIVFGGSDGVLRTLDPDTGRVRERAIKHEVVGLAVSADGRTIGSGHDDGILRVWPLSTFENPKTLPIELKAHQATIQQVAFSGANPSRVVSAGDDGRIIVWNLQQRCVEQRSKEQKVRIMNIALNADGSMVAAASADATVRIFRFLTNVTACRPSSATSAGTNASPTSEFDIVPQGALTGHGGFVLGIAWNSQGNRDRIASVAQDGSIRIWGPSTGGFSLAELTARENETLARTTALAVSADNESIAAGDNAGRVHVWDPARHDFEPGVNQARASWMAHPNSSIRALAYARIGERAILISAGDDGLVRRWDAKSQAPIAPDLADQAKPIRSIAVSTDGQRLAAGSVDGVVRLWDIATGRRIRVYQIFRGAPDPYQLSSVAFTNDGKYLAVGSSATPNVRLIELGESAQERFLHGHGDGVTALARSKQHWLLSSGLDGVVLEWGSLPPERPGASDMLRRKEYRFRLGFGDVRSLSTLHVSDAGNLVIAGGQDGLIQAWDGTRQVLVGHEFPFYKTGLDAVAVSPNNRFFVTAAGGVVHAWPGPEVWPDLICSKLVSNMTHEQWRDWMSKVLPYQKQCPDLPVPDEPPAPGQ